MPFLSNRPLPRRHPSRLRPVRPPTKEDVCQAIMSRAQAIACDAEHNLYACARDICQGLGWRYAEVQAILLALELIADDDPRLAQGLIETLKRISIGETYVWELPHPAQRYVPFVLRHDLRFRQKLSNLEAKPEAQSKDP